MKKGKSARVSLLAGPMSRAERPDRPNFRATNLKEAGAKANPLPNRTEPNHEPVELSYGAGSIGRFHCSGRTKSRNHAISGRRSFFVIAASASLLVSCGGERSEAPLGMLT